jgi:3-oxoacyl-[acyl-carrier-protein] synthase-3
VVSTASPDFHLPGVATLVQDQLGLRRCAAIDIRSGCAGAVEALDLARMYIERGDHRHAVVVGSEAISPLMVPVFLGRNPEKVRMRDRLGVYNFGDGAGALVLSRDDEADEGIIGASALACIGGGRAPGMQVVGGATHAPIHRQLEAKRLIELKVDVVEAGRFTPFVLTEGMQDTLARAGVTADAIDACVIPEGNATYMTDELRAAGLLTPEWTALEPKIVENLASVGATGSAAVPLAVDDAVLRGCIEPGDVVMLLAIETSKWKFGGLVARWTAPAPAEAAATADAAAAPA